MNKICFFSSDARPLYKSDIFRVMSYPRNYIIHFRYRDIHVVGDPLKLMGKSGVIFYSIGNDLTRKENERVISNVSIREVTIHLVQKSLDTDQVHFYLRLGDFKSIELLENPSDILPPHKMVTELHVQERPNIKWYQVIDLIKSSFPNKLFYKFEIRNKKTNKIIDPLYDRTEKQSYYRLTDESSYALEMGFYDTEPSSSDNYHSLKITPQDSEVVKVVAPTSIELETRKDDRIYSIFTKTVSSSNSFTYINFETIQKSAIASTDTTPNLKTPIIDTTLKIEVGKNTSRSLFFAFFSILTAIALGYASILFDEVDVNGDFNLNLSFQFLICMILGFFSAFKLYRIFDKK